jgi:hypothetical protein
MFQLITSNFVSVPLTDIVAGARRRRAHPAHPERELGGPGARGGHRGRAGHRPAAVKLEGQEGLLLRKVIGWSPGMLVVLATLIFLQSTPVLGWMLP